ncbi:MAG: S23 ribosomal protein [Candidatus Peregrinibacteria bacterium Gr01-1014_25]|nr:MAG: S23 ribosomal protein [Candidatus Peregrinibacteria bacterium Gr01-1014_25]
MLLAEHVYALTKKFPKEEQYGLVSQLRRAAVSIPSNIAEGSQRTSDREFANFLLVAKGSLAELLTQITLAHTFGYVPKSDFSAVRESIDALSKMLHSFHSKLKAHSS